MATFRITATYEYSGEVEADTEDEARKAFWEDLNTFYVSTEDEEIEKLETCEVCGESYEEGVLCCEDESEDA